MERGNPDGEMALFDGGPSRCLLDVFDEQMIWEDAVL
jgi:hypothetical protein